MHIIIAIMIHHPSIIHHCCFAVGGCVRGGQEHTPLPLLSHVYVYERERERDCVIDFNNNNNNNNN